MNWRKITKSKLFCVAFFVGMFSPTLSQTQEGNSLKIKEVKNRLSGLQNTVLLESKLDSMNSTNIELNSCIKELGKGSTNDKLEIERLRNLLQIAGVNPRSNSTLRSLTNIDVEKNYVIIASLRTLSDVQKWMSEMQDLDLVIGQNKNKTWYHIVINSDFDRKEATQLVNKLGKAKYPETWMTTGAWFFQF
jgi:hypothetical protein